MMGYFANGTEREMKDSLSPVALSRLTWTFEDRRAWDDAYRAAIRINAVRSAYVLASAHPENEERYSDTLAILETGCPGTSIL